MYKPNFHTYQDSWGSTDGSGGSNSTTPSWATPSYAYSGWGQDNGGSFGGSDSWGGDSMPNYSTGPRADKDSPADDPGHTPKEPSWSDNVTTFLKKYGPKIAGAWATTQFGPLAGLFAGGIGNYLAGDKKDAKKSLGQSIFGAGRDAMAGFAQREAGIPGSMVAGAINTAANQPGQGGSSRTPNKPSNDPYLGGLGNVFRSSLNYYNTRDAMSDLNSQRAGLTGLYDQNGAYAQNLRNQLAARASAGGSRGQVSSSEVALQAELAKMAAQMSPQISNIDANRQSVRTNRNAQYYNILSDIFAD